ncbi:undecaprenyl-diphosphatase UppP [Candidatus Kaiserbacteria bacterium RIFCSPHIGHO2_01_FULL_50_13]|uniref:Undecaprenyl-diphosphatase n=1 Tax=Candidatus Kaiserbacteria bacterium RIFCSPLOWO2_01_FULL_50_24 TaxID=1798507 RepID=A0A1F6EME3_9BACT|nr:MAG: undecaprenyl-diphosphatase UppP [Candidatus Kaiserbacteria bacterium RIFCSPHIGHO2_01_FULL_50_13]OGG74817.1 MAG: undecaprenyl-diphosphatase UppP [Candidatus Kaiserbacteria bacterium RIFCSPLOWO2_01_FULL_50_24]OGG81400.1 MAG: undecaprenyl-diphosphatase UppP [Candidatus Kaiserbacteria bacterium RIFCSPLOWO2_02_FULL_51_13]
MTFLESILLGIVEGATEFLPISSTGHLILASSVLGLPHTEFLKSFEIAIQLGAIASVVVLYWRSFLDIELLKRLAAAFIPTGILGFLLYPYVKEYLMGNMAVVLWALALGGIALIIFERWHRELPCSTYEVEHGGKPVGCDVRDITYQQSVFIGLFQTLAMVPGVSRSGATIIGGLLLGLRRTVIVEFSFLLAVPTMLAATGYDMYKNAGVFAADQFLLLVVGFITSFIVAMFAIKWLLRFVQTHSFTSFGVYRLLLVLVFILFVL